MFLTVADQPRWLVLQASTSGRGSSLLALALERTHEGANNVHG